MSALTAARLRELFHYEPSTGVFTRLKPAGACKAGDIAGSRHIAGYVELGVDGKSYLAHRLAWLYVYGEWPSGKLDHRDTIRTHNWIDNLRPATDQQNAQNTNPHRDNKTGLKGVSYHRKARKFRATIWGGDRQQHLGLFNTAEEAAEAYRKAASAKYGDFYRANPS